jgi:hypothetical protein
MKRESIGCLNKVAAHTSLRIAMFRRQGHERLRRFLPKILILFYFMIVFYVSVGILFSTAL